MKLIISLIGLFIFMYDFNSQAAIQKDKTKIQVPLITKDGIYIGGVAKSAFSIKDIRLTSNLKTKQERIVIDIGDLNGRSITGKIGFYQIEKKENQVVITFSQTPKLFIDSKRVVEKFKSGRNFTKFVLTQDLDDNNQQIQLNLNKNTKVRFFDVVGGKQTAKLVIDLFNI